jgi:methylmalonyl-CoA mutase
VIVGVNKYQIEGKPLDEVLEVPERFATNRWPACRPCDRTTQRRCAASALAGVTQAAESGGNLLAAAIAAVRARATVGEISDAMENVFGRYVATTQCISGVYASEFQDQEVIAALRKRTEQFMEKQGRGRVS